MHRKSIELLVFWILIIATCGCSEELDMQGAEKGTFEYWCMVSGGTWILDSEEENTNATSNTVRTNEFCKCGTSICGNGIICVREGDALRCAGEPPQNGSENPENANAADGANMDGNQESSDGTEEKPEQE